MSRETLHHNHLAVNIKIMVLGMLHGVLDEPAASDDITLHSGIEGGTTFTSLRKHCKYESTDHNSAEGNAVSLSFSALTMAK
jgi:hypothetical protein